jgi:hypothetical protein
VLQVNNIVVALCDKFSLDDCPHDEDELHDGDIEDLRRMAGSNDYDKDEDENTREGPEISENGPHSF